MKTNILIAAGILFASGLYAQTSTSRNQQGKEVSAAAKTAASAESRGEIVSDAATARAKGSANAAVEAQSDAVSKTGAQTRKEARKARAAAKKQVKQSVDKSNNELESVSATTSSDLSVQTAASTNNEHGVMVSTAAKSETEAGAKGAQVSEVASVKAEGNVNARPAVKKVKEVSGRTRAKARTTVGSVKAPRTTIKTRAGVGAGIGIH